jgi:hypothetical protein
MKNNRRSVSKRKKNNKIIMNKDKQKEEDKKRVGCLPQTLSLMSSARPFKIYILWFDQ